MDLRNLLNQLKISTNPTQMLMGMLNSNQKQQVNQMQGLNNQEQAQKVADKCNELGITKEQLQGIINSFK